MTSCIDLLGNNAVLLVVGPSCVISTKAHRRVVRILPFRFHLPGCFAVMITSLCSDVCLLLSRAHFLHKNQYYSCHLMLLSSFASIISFLNFIVYVLLSRVASLRIFCPFLVWHFRPHSPQPYNRCQFAYCTYCHPTKCD